MGVLVLWTVQAASHAAKGGLSCESKELLFKIERRLPKNAGWFGWRRFKRVQGMTVNLSGHMDRHSFIRFLKNGSVFSQHPPADPLFVVVGE
jgi:hypothetical protein